MNKNILLQKNDLKDKYGQVKIMVIKNSHIIESMNDPYFLTKNFIDAKTININDFVKMFNGAEYMLRYEAEVDDNYKQPIPYIIFIEESTNKIFCMKRIGGDSRLIGMKSIGVGGHIDENETLQDALYREIKEEINLDKEDINKLDFSGIILDTSNNVGSVHLGLLYKAYVKEDLNICCTEKDKLTGYFVEIEELENEYINGTMETWTEIAYKNILRLEN